SLPLTPPPIISCKADIRIDRDPGTCSATLLLTPPTVSDTCDIILTPIPTRSDRLPMDAPYPCGQTVVTWTVKNSENLTSSCQQVVIVPDETPPAFLHVPPPVTVTTGPGAMSCGAIVEESRLGITAPGSDPVMLDLTGDVRDPSSSLQHDIISTAATFDRDSITFTVSFAEQIFPESSGNPRSLRGLIEIDTDQNSGTGARPLVDLLRPPEMNLGVEFQITLFNESRHPGFVDIRMPLPSNDDVFTGRVPILFTDTSFSVTVPLSMLGSDNGLVNYGVGVYMADIGETDRAPNGAVPATSVPVPELIAMDDAPGVTISRSGIPANNLFAVGETFITYTATDASGNSTSVIQTVTVVDDTAPVISGVTASPLTLWPPNHGMVDVTVSYDATDNCAIVETSLSVSGNEPATGAAGSDWEVVDAHHVRLRAARWGRRGDRLYILTITAKDIHGNLSSQNVTVTVPLNNGKGP
ncbi:MAG TPA: hypothetical protein VKA78_02260, partial [Pyrinomonadaceae bacterium]|nr:hypothetical protein [Pyrinomonadaceae bacterium]